MHIVVPLESQRVERVQLFQKMQHALPSFVLLGDGVKGLSGDATGLALLLAVAEIVTSVAVIASVAWSIRRVASRGPVHYHGIDWVDILLGAMLLTEALAHARETGHLPRPTILLAVVMLGLGLFHNRIFASRRRRRVLRITDDGIAMQSRPFRAFSASWSDIASITIADRDATIATKDGRTGRINLNDFHNARDVVAALTDAKTNLERRT